MFSVLLPFPYLFDSFDTDTIYINNKMFLLSSCVLLVMFIFKLIQINLEKSANLYFRNIIERESTIKRLSSVSFLSHQPSELLVSTLHPSQILLRLHTIQRKMPGLWQTDKGEDSNIYGVNIVLIIW